MFYFWGHAKTDAAAKYALFVLQFVLHERSCARLRIDGVFSHNLKKEDAEAWVHKFCSTLKTDVILDNKLEDVLQMAEYVYARYPTVCEVKLASNDPGVLELVTGAMFRQLCSGLDDNQDPNTESPTRRIVVLGIRIIG